MVDIICDNKKLIYSNRICCINDDSINLQVKLSDTDILKIIFNFTYNGEEFATSLKSPTNGTVVFELNNYNNPLGSGLKAPAKIGEYKGKEILAMFYVYKISAESLPILDVSLYMEV